MSSSQFFGLSLSERLNKVGITSLFAVAVKAKDIAKMKKLLQSIEYSDESADATINTFLENSDSFNS